MEGYTIFGSILIKTIKELEKRGDRTTAYEDIFEVDGERRCISIYNKSIVSGTDDIVEGYVLFNGIFLDDI